MIYIKIWAGKTKENKGKIISEVPVCEMYKWEEVGELRKDIAEMVIKLNKIAWDINIKKI